MHKQILAGILTAGLFASQSAICEPNSEAEPALDIYEALEKAVSYLRTKAEEDDDLWLDAPQRIRERTGSKEVEVRYSRKTVDVPVYETYYEEEYRDVKVSDASGAPTVRKKVKVKKRRQTGTRPEERVVRDKNGDIVKTETRPVYATGGEVRWDQYQRGNNALAAYALVVAGVDPSDPAVMNAADHFMSEINAFGRPDETWTLAWMTCLFSVVPDETYALMARTLAEKLMAGQFTEGPMTGLWGPICVNRPSLAHLIEERELISQEYVKAQQKGDEEALQSIQSRLDAIGQSINWQSLYARANYEAETYLNIKDDFGRKASYPGSTEYIFNQCSADLESTAVALYALSVAGKNDRLPDKTLPPLDGKLKKPVVTPRTPASVLVLAMRTVNGAQDPSGKWNSMNLHGAVRDFDKITSIRGLPSTREPFPRLPQTMDVTTTSAGYSCLASTARLTGVEAMQKFTENIARAGMALAEYFDKLKESNEAQGGNVPPFDALFYAGRPVGSEPPEVARRIREGGIRFLLETQGKDGSWGNRRMGVNMRPTSVRARMKVLPDLHKQNLKTFDLSQPHVPIAEPNPDGKEFKSRGSVINHRFSSPREVLATAYGILFLAERISEDDRAVREPTGLQQQ